MFFQREVTVNSVLQKVELKSGSNAQIVAVPGILARIQEQLRPLMPVFTRFDAAVTGVNYSGTRFDAEQCITALRQTIEPNLASGRPTVMFASSLGGMLVAQTLMQLRPAYGVNALNRVVSTVIVDSPASGKDLFLLPNLSGDAGPRIGMKLRNFTPNERSNGSYGRLLLKTFGVPPKDKEIEVVPGGLRADEIKQRAIEGLSGHPFTVWYDQLVWMLNSSLNLNGLDGLNVTYVACTANNMTVRQPQARDAWAPHVKRVIEVATPHCAYLQAQPSWTKALTPLFDQLIRSH